MKLSPAQRKVLEAMAEGAVLCASIGRCAISYKIGGKRLSEATFDALFVARLIKGKSGAFCIHTYELTDAGREALK
jgi:hypothetical protein